MALSIADLPRVPIGVYLCDERSRPERCEYLDGHVYAMSGESIAHGILSVNLTVSLGTQLRGGPCRLFTKDMKILCGPYRADSLEGLFAYPDIVVVCGTIQTHDQVRDVVLNPTLLLEVLSPSTATYDRGAKFQRYRDWLPSLQDYLLVAQDRVLIDHFQRGMAWGMTRYEGLDAVVPLLSIGCRLPLVDIYDGVTFTAEEP
jgi:Uma2 family endonuclease